MVLIQVLFVLRLLLKETACHGVFLFHMHESRLLAVVQLYLQEPFIFLMVIPEKIIIDLGYEALCCVLSSLVLVVIEFELHLTNMIFS